MNLNVLGPLVVAVVMLVIVYLTGENVIGVTLEAVIRTLVSVIT